MEGAQTPKVAAGLLERDVLADDLGDVGSASDLLSYGFPSPQCDDASFRGADLTAALVIVQMSL